MSPSRRLRRTMGSLSFSKDAFLRTAIDKSYFSPSSSFPPFRQYRLSLTRHFCSTYEWFRDQRHPVTQRIVEFESRLVQECLASSAELYKRLIIDAAVAGESASMEAKSRVQGDRVGDFYYMSERPEKANNIVISRKANDSDSYEVIVDLNKLETAFPRPISVQLCRPSVDHRFVGLLLICGQDNSRVLLVKDTKTEKMYRVTLPSLGMYIQSFEFGTSIGDNTSIYVTLSRDELRPCTVYQCKLWHVISNDCIANSSARARSNLAVIKTVSMPPLSLRLIAQEIEDARLFLDVTRSKDNKYVIIHSHSKSCSEARIYEESASAIRLFSKRVGGLQYFVTSCGESFYIVSNLGRAGAGLKLLKWSATNADTQQKPENNAMSTYAEWAPVYPGSSHEVAAEISDVLHVTDIDISPAGRAVLYGRKAGRPGLSVIDLRTGRETCFQKDIEAMVRCPAYQLFPAANEGSDDISFTVSSPLTQEIEGQIHLRQSELKIDWASTSSPLLPSLRSLSPKYPSSRHPSGTSIGALEVTVASFDGTGVPMYLVGREENLVVRGGGSNKKAAPVLMIGYGSYGVSLPMHYRPEVSVLLREGWTVAYACARGGGELGPSWHAQGRGESKWNTFIDFAACAAYLHSQGYVSHGGLCAEFESAGGLIGGVMYTHFAALFSGIVLRNAFLDPWASMLDPTMPLTEHEYDEWGNPRDSVVSKYIKSYSPCSNVIAPSEIPSKYSEFIRGFPRATVASKKPKLLVSCSLQDRNVAPWDALKWLHLVRGSVDREDFDLLLHSKDMYTSKTYAAFKSGRMRQPIGSSSTIDPSEVFFHVLPDADHSGPRVLEDAAGERGVELAFLSRCVRQGAH